MTADLQSAPVLLEARNVVKEFPIRGASREHRARAVTDVSFEIRRGETVGLVGETGCGKSTLARCVTRLHELTSGTIIFDGQDISMIGRRRLRPVRRNLQMIFQDPYSSLNPRRTVGSIIGEPFAIHRVADGRERKRRVQELMEVVGLNPEHYNRFPAAFSGGQRQRIGVARALALKPKLIVCDEPVSALDVSIQAQIINLLMDLQHDFDLTYLFIAHDLAVVEQVSHRVMVMYLGQIAEMAPSDELYARPRHPYTAALLSAVPIPNPDVSDRRHQIVLFGDIPSPAAPPPGCRFHTRCPRAEPRCRQVPPPFEPVLGDTPQHRTACYVPLANGEQLREPSAGTGDQG